MKDVIIIGGGLAGLIASMQLAKAGLNVVLLEKHHYPFHKVCGEYISNEVTPFLQSIDAYPEAFKPAQVTSFRLSSVGGAETTLPLSLGGFGISRYCFDEFLSKKAEEAGAQVRQGAHVQEVRRQQSSFKVVLRGGEELSSRLVIGAWGKRSRLDKQLARPFMELRSDFIGVKYHIRGDLPPNEIALHNFPGGYCGLSKVEDNTWNLCYLGSRSRLRHWGSIEAMEEKDLQQNPHLRKIFRENEFLFQKPLVINEVNFSFKQAVDGGVLMAGDASGLITPLCGNGMAMAIHAGKILSELIVMHYEPGTSGSQEKLEQAYKNAWQKQFARRLWMGRQFQLLFGHPLFSVAALQLLRLKPLGRLLVRQTHGKVF
ncbi:NAD(P)/FAD-dependent oxidoreductase [Cesiribacter sp. SM1]|uniref:NAD(P)/FAD-dependent oxidoreductase n=1 Tax=Cesiribacter sp. SM1 TaxID=2861196 RepID=UPI001CD626C1